MTLPLVLLATRCSAGSVMLPPLKLIRPSVKSSDRPARLIPPRRSSKPPSVRGARRGAAEFHRAAELDIETAAADIDLLRRFQRDVQRRSPTRWSGGAGGRTWAVHRQHRDGRGHPFRDAHLGAPHMHGSADQKLPQRLAAQRQVGVERSR